MIPQNEEELVFVINSHLAILQHSNFIADFNFTRNFSYSEPKTVTHQENTFQQLINILCKTNNETIAEKLALFLLHFMQSHQGSTFLSLRRQIINILDSLLQNNDGQLYRYVKLLNDYMSTCERFLDSKPKPPCTLR